MTRFTIAMSLLVMPVMAHGAMMDDQPAQNDPMTVVAQLPMPVVNVRQQIQIQPVARVQPLVRLQPQVRLMMVAQVKDDLLAGTEKFAQGAAKVTEINLDPTTMGMMGEHGRDGAMARKMDLMVVHSYVYDKPGMYRMDDVEQVRKKLEGGSWSCPVHVRSEGGSTDICSRAGSDHETNEMVIISAAPQKLTFIHMRGKVPLSELGNMGGAEKEFDKSLKTPEMHMPPPPPRSPKPAPAAPGAAPTPPTPPTPPM